MLQKTQGYGPNLSAPASSSAVVALRISPPLQVEDEAGGNVQMWEIFWCQPQALHYHLILVYYSFQVGDLHGAWRYNQEEKETSSLRISFPIFSCSLSLQTNLLRRYFRPHLPSGRALSATSNRSLFVSEASAAVVQRKEIQCEKTNGNKTGKWDLLNYLQPPIRPWCHTRGMTVK